MSEMYTLLLGMWEVLAMTTCNSALPALHLLLHVWVLHVPAITPSLRPGAIGVKGEARGPSTGSRISHLLGHPFPEHLCFARAEGDSGDD